MTFLEMAWIILRKWWVFFPILILGLLGARALNDTGAEYIAVGRITVVSPRTDNTLLTSTRTHYRGPAIVAAVEMLGAEYRNTLRDAGLPDDFEFNYRDEYPIVIVVLRGPTHAGVTEAIEVVADDYVDRLDQIQADRDIVGAARLGGEVTSVNPPSRRPPGSKKALLGLVAAVTALAAGAAYGVDQFVLPARRATSIPELER
ncbi:MAG: hypothetical protein RIB98_09660 [Acidimicrobiales bacterium]